MRVRRLALCLCLALSQFAEATIHDARHAVARQESSSALPTLGASSSSQSPASSASSSPSPNSATTTAPGTSSSSTSRSPSSAVVSNTASNSTSIASSTATDTVPTLAPVANSTDTNNSTTSSSKNNELPLEPHITPALSIGGAVLLLTGLVYAVIGVKNIWIHVFLSTAYLTSLSVLVLIVYVMSPPIKDAIQGAYFVGIFMTGLIFGTGALVFKEITEGLGCLLGGFCLAMWFLTLKAGGLITSTTGKATFIAIFCVVCWGFSFSRYTRPYALIGSTSFSGSTVFVLGIDCFSRAGLKEFWVYIWALNDNLFPLGTDTFPITRGTRVETIVIVLGCIVGIISQIKLWKVVQNRQKQRAAVQAEDDRRRDAVEEALGRHLERQNDRDKSEWEKRYGDRLGAKRNTILWSDAHPEKRMSSYSTTEIDSSQMSPSENSVEMSQLNQNFSRQSLYSSKGNKRQSHLSVQVIREVEEDDQASLTKTERPQSQLMESARSGESTLNFELSPPPQSDQGEQNDNLSSSLKPHNSKPLANEVANRLQLEGEGKATKKRSSLQSLNDLKRRSWQSIRSHHSGDKSPREPNSLNSPLFSESKEALVVTNESMGTHSRASSIAATLDEENETIDIQELPPIDTSRKNRPPQIVISPVHGMSFEDQLSNELRAPPSPSAQSEDFESDPEAIVRRPTASSQTNSKSHQMQTLPTETDQFHTLHGEGPKSSDGNSQSSSTAVLTKDALENVPSQMSNVVLSYRTNEWAKHIATAEAPMFEEPEPIESHDNEAPAHLADPKSPSIGSDDTSQRTEKPPELPSPLVAVAPSDHGVKVNPEAQPIVSSSSRRASGDYSTSEQETPKPAHDSNETVPATTNALEATSNHNERRNSNPGPRQAPLQNTTINENEVMTFPANPNRTKRASTGADRSSHALNYTRPTTAAARSSSQNLPFTFHRSSSAASLHYSTLESPKPNTSHISTSNISSNPLAMHSDTRLSSYNSSHQPLSRQNTDSSRREALMADWRMSNRQSNTAATGPRQAVDDRRAQVMLEREADKFRREKEKSQKARKEAAFDQSMRTQPMINAHKEVLRRMQSKANEKLVK